MNGKPIKFSTRDTNLELHILRSIEGRQVRIVFMQGGSKSELNVEIVDLVNNGMNPPWPVLSVRRVDYFGEAVGAPFAISLFDIIEIKVGW